MGEYLHCIRAEELHVNQRSRAVEDLIYQWSSAYRIANLPYAVLTLIEEFGEGDRHR